MVTFVRRIGVWGLVAGVALVGGCKVRPTDPFSARQAQQQMRRHAAEVEPREMRPLPTKLESPYLLEPEEAAPEHPPPTGQIIEERPTVRMSLQEIVHRTVANNLEVRVAGYSPAIDQTRVIEAEARFDPTFFTNFTFANQTTLAPSQQNPFLPPGQAITFRSLALDTGLRQELESGGRVELRYQPARTKRSPGDFFEPNPFYTSDLTLQLTQPLLRDFGAEINRARITIARNNVRISLLDFREQLERSISDIERVYWQLAQGLREVAIADELLDRTIGTADILFKRMGQDVTRIQMSQANASVETRRALLIRARARVHDLSDQLKGLMNDPEFPVTGAVVILPATEPLEELVRFSLDDQISTAMENRVELGQQQLRIDSATIATQVARNNLLPQLNAIGSVGVIGLGSTLGRAIDEQSDFDHVNYTIGLQLEIPIGNRAARAIWRRTQLQRLQAIDNYRMLVEQVSADVKIATREVETSWEEIVATRNARFAAEDQLRAIEAREEAAEALTPAFIDIRLRAQETLAEAQRTEAVAVANYNLAIARLQRAKGTLLRYNNIVMEEAPLVRY